MRTDAVQAFARRCALPVNARTLSGNKLALLCCPRSVGKQPRTCTLTLSPLAPAAPAQDHALSTLAFYLFHQADLIRKFDIKPHLLARWVSGAQRGSICGE